MAVGEFENNLVETDIELVQPQVERGLTLVPSRFLLPNVTSPSATSRFTLPVLSFKDLAGEKRVDTMAKLKHACEDWGLFQVSTIVSYIYIENPGRSSYSNCMMLFFRSLS